MASRWGLVTERSSSVQKLGTFSSATRLPRRGEELETNDLSCQHDKPSIKSQATQFGDHPGWWTRPHVGRWHTLTPLDLNSSLSTLQDLTLYRSSSRCSLECFVISFIIE